MNTRRYVIRQRDYVTQLAYRFRLNVEEIWGHAKNNDLRQCREDMDIVHPGDILHVPASPVARLPVTVGGDNHYRATIPHIEIRLVLRDAYAGPIAEKAYTVEGVGRPMRGTTDSNGAVLLQVPVFVREATLIFDDSQQSFRLLIGAMDPVGETSGVDKRLAQLGYLHLPHGRARGPSDGERRAAIAAFQKAQGLTPTGEIDETTRDALECSHGS